MSIILGIDPGSRITGYGVIEIEDNNFRYLASGRIMMRAGTLAGRLGEIFQGVSEIIQCYQPDESAIEQVFVHQNVASALKLGHARGAAITALANALVPVAEYTPRQVKQAVVGYGAADKTQVQHMVKCLLNLVGQPAIDASDALAIAICHANFDMKELESTMLKGKAIREDAF